MKLLKWTCFEKYIYIYFLIATYLAFLQIFMLLYLKAFKVDQLKEFNIQQVQAIEPSTRGSLPPAKAQALHAIENEERGSPRKSIFYILISSTNFNSSDR